MSTMRLLKSQRSTVLGAISSLLVLGTSLSGYAEQLSQNTRSMASQTLSSFPINDCYAQLDAIVALAAAEPDDNGYLEQRLASLESRCPGLPQFAHNRGVLAAKSQRWNEAIEHFNRSLNLDARASLTHRHLQQIFEYRAAQAYALALNTPNSAQPPQLVLQRSTDQNANASLTLTEQSRLKNISTLEYEMYAWWQALQDSNELDDYYVQDFPTEAIGLGTQDLGTHPWADMQREIAFTQNDAVVVLSDPQQKRTLLLLRLVATRWKIYQETAL